VSPSRAGLASQLHHPGFSAGLSATQKVAEHNGVTMLHVLCGKQQSHRMSARRSEDRLPGFGVRSQLRLIAFSEYAPARGIVAKPLPQRGARRHVPEPAFEGQILLPDAAGPEPIDEKPRATRARRQLVDTCNVDSKIHIISQ